MTEKKESRFYEPEEKRRLIEEFEQSGMSVLEFTSSKGMSRATFSLWLKIKKSGRDPGVRLKKGLYSPEQRKQAIEAYRKSGLSLQDFADTWRIGASTLMVWQRCYEKHGAKGLEAPFLVENPKKRGPKGISRALKSEIVRAKHENPDSGLRKVRHFLMRFRGVKVSAGTINKTLKAEGIEPTPVRRRRRRSPNKIKRFERARAMQLWQSDITSFILPRHSQRIYLVAFLDDYSRYIVAWNLQLRQTQDLVIDALFKGIERFGKPEEVLTDQGRQYFSWRGKSDFQKLLIKQGIKHVVARSHHPQTVGKCERLWKAIGDELFERVRPNDFEEARSRLEHFFNHYNHFRPHQGIDGMTPADRFFGVESEVRKALEESYSKNELRLAIGAKPRSPVFLIGQIGDQPISMHGEAGKLVVHTPNGEIKRLDYEDFGHAAKTTTKGERDESTESRTQDREGTGKPSEEGTGPASGLQDASEARGASEVALGAGLDRAEREGPSDGCGDSGVLDGAHHEGRGGQTAGDSPASGLATGTTGNIGYAGRATDSAQNESERNDHGSSRRPESIEKENCGTGSNSTQAGSSDRGAEVHAGVSGDDTARGNAGSESSGGADECDNKAKEDKDGQGSSR